MQTAAGRPVRARARWDGRATARRRQEQQRPAGRGLSEQGQHRIGHHSPVRRRSLAEAESHAQRLAERPVEPAQVLKQRQEKLVQPGEADVGLEFGTGRAQFFLGRR